MRRHAACLVALLLAGAAQAGSFSVNPIRLDLPMAQRATALTVSNATSDSALLQVSVYRWSRRGGEDVLDEVSGAEAPVVTPPLFRLAGSGSQIVRIGFRKLLAPGDPESQWRVIVEEVPQPVAAGTAPGPIAIAMRLRVSLPLFRLPAVVTQDLRWDADSTGGALRLTASNLGTSTERVDEIALADASGPALGRLAGPLYIFPGEERRFDLSTQPAQASGALRLSLLGTPRPLVRDLVFRAR